MDVWQKDCGHHKYLCDLEGDPKHRSIDSRRRETDGAFNSKHLFISAEVRRRLTCARALRCVSQT